MLLYLISHMPRKVSSWFLKVSIFFIFYIAIIPSLPYIFVKYPYTSLYIDKIFYIVPNFLLKTTCILAWDAM